MLLGVFLRRVISAMGENFAAIVSEPGYSGQTIQAKKGQTGNAKGTSTLKNHKESVVIIFFHRLQIIIELRNIGSCPLLNKLPKR